MKKFIISEEERKEILSKHASKGLTLSEKISDLNSEDLEEGMDSELDESYDEMDEEIEETYDEMGEEIEETYDEMDEGAEMTFDAKAAEIPESTNPKYEESLKEEDMEENIYELELDDEEDEDPFEKGPRGMRAARTRADFDPSAREIEMSGVFGKHAEDVPPTTIRYMRKNPGSIVKRLADMYGIDKINQWLGQ